MSRRPQALGRKTQAPDFWCIDLHVERSSLFAYSYRRLRVERAGRRASVRELSLQLDYDHDLNLVSKPRRVVRQRGRSLQADEAERLWRRIAQQRPERLEDAYPCLDDVDPAGLDEATVDGVPVAVLLGEEGPACLTIRTGREKERVKRIVIDRYRESTEAPRGRLATIVAAIDPGLRDAQAFNYRKSRGLEDLAAEFQELKSLVFLNLREFERRAVEALGFLGDREALPFITGELFASDPMVRLRALDALETIGSGCAAADVELLCYDDDPSVRERAREVLERLRQSV